jgi:hypothetical protein
MKTKKSFFGIAIVLIMAIAIVTLIGCPEPDPESKVPAATVTSVTVSPKTPSVVKGGTQQFTATVTGTNNPAQTVTWTIETAGKNAGTTIDGTGKLTVAAAEALTSLIVKATSTVDTGKSDTATVGIYNAGTLPTVTSVTVSPPTVSIAKGGTQQFTAAVTGTNNPAQTVTWTIETAGKNAGTTIDGAGKLTVAAAETLTSLTVRATSTVDTTKYGSATVTFVNPTPNPVTGNMGQWEFGYNNEYKQAVWQFTGNNAAVLKGATGIELGLNAKPTQGLEFVWQDTATWGWNNTAILSNSGTAQNGASWDEAAKKLTIDFNTAIANRTSFLAQTGNIQIVFQFAGSNINSLGITSANLIADGELTPVVTSVSVNPSAATVAKGGSWPFHAIVSGTGNVAQTVTWTIDNSGSTKVGTYIETSGTLHIASDETLTSLTVRATSTADTSVSGTAAVTISSGSGGGGQVYMVNVEPWNPVKVYPGKTAQFTAIVYGTGDYAQTVTWTFGKYTDAGAVSTGSAVTAGGSTISSSGLVTVGHEENDNSFLYVVATSTADTTISAVGYVDKILSLHPIGLVDGAVAKAGSAAFSVFDSDLGYWSEKSAFNWSVVETNKATGTYWDENYGSLIVADNETLLNLTVRAALKSDPAIYMTAKAKVVSVDRVTTNAANIGIAKGGSFTLTAAVHGENNPPQNVTWEFNYNPTDTPLDPGTTFNEETGLLTIGAGEKNKSIRLRAFTELSSRGTVEYGMARIYTYNPNAGTGYIVEIDDTGYDGNGRKTITLSNLQYNEIFLSKVNPTGNPLLSGGIYSHLISPSARLRPAPRSNVQIKTPVYTKGHPAITAFNENPPAITPSLRAKLNASKPDIRFSGSTVGQIKNFWVGFDGSVYSQQQATLLATGTYGNIWAAENNMISTTMAQAYADKFDILYPAMTNVFGYEYGGGPGGDGGRDGDTKVQILFCNPQSADGTALAGWFSSADFYDQATLDATYGANRYRTNEAEIFYMRITAPLDDVFDTLAHEFQHMINFNQKFLIQGGGAAGSASPAWYNEMLSLVAEDLMASTLGFDADSNAVVFNFFMEALFDGMSSASNSLTNWGNNFRAYGNKYAFGAYLLRNYGGAPLIKAMLANNTTGIPSIEAALQQVAGVTFAQAFSRYGEALIYGFRNIPDGANTYEKAFPSIVNGTTYNILAFNPWAYNAERYFYADTNSTLLAYSVQIETPTALRGNEILGSVDITIQRPANGVKLYLLVK